MTSEQAAPVPVAPQTLPGAGALVHLDFRKHDGREHWQEPYRVLGVDEWGVWLGMSAGTAYGRPGLDVVAPAATVRLLPHADAAGGGRWAACFNAAPPTRADRPADQEIRTYVDISTRPVWHTTPHGWRATLIDMDLDVVERFGGEVFIDDEDEFEEHTSLFGYSDELVAVTRAAAEAVFAMVRDHQAPFDGTGEGWLQAL